jgi:hypothetical protein
MSHHDDYPEDGRPFIGDLILVILAALGLGLVFLGAYALAPYVVIR